MNFDFRGQSLRGVDFTGQDLHSANFARCDLRDAIFTEANLRNASFKNAYLKCTVLNAKIPPVNDVDFISEILWREAQTEKQKDFAGRLKLENSTSEFLVILARRKGLLEWVKDTLYWEEYKMIIETYE